MQKLHSVSLAVSICLSVTSLPIVAEESAADQQRIVITGSHIKRLEQESSSPLTLISSDDIARSGAGSLVELLQATVFSSGASLNNQQTGGFTPGAASYNLRGLRTDRTLVLVDGHRLPSYPFGQDGNIAFVDLNTIPLAEIDSIEILTDGASAVYGSDAIAGVVNIKTKKEYSNNNLSIKALTSSGNYRDTSVSLLTGFAKDTSDFIFVAEFQDIQPMLGEDLKLASSLLDNDLSIYSFPGSYLTLDANSEFTAAPAANCGRSVSADTFFVDVSGDFCINDWAGERQIIPQNQRAAISLKWNHYFGDTSLLTGLSVNQVETDSDVPFGLLGGDFFVPAADDNNPLGEDMIFYRGFDEIGLPKISTKAQNYRANIGVEGFIGSFDYSLVMSHALTKIDEVYADGWVHANDRDSLFNSINDGEVNPFVALSHQQITDLTSSFKHRGESKQTSVSFNLSGELVEWESGTVYLATGAELRKESISDTSDQAIIDGEVVGLGSSAAKGDRDIGALFAELIVPASEDFEINLAVRYDDYSDFGSSVNPKLSMSYTPLDSLLLRTSWGTGFRAPNLFELHSDQVTGSVGTIPFIKVANPDLEAETSESFNFGVVFDINERFMASFDYWQIEVEDIITNLGVGTILTAQDVNGDLIYQDLISFNPDNSIAQVTDPFLNLDEQKAQGIDLATSLAFTEEWTLKVNASHMLKLEQVNTALDSKTELDGEYLYPRNRVNASLIYKTGSFGHAITAYYLGSHGEELLKTDSYTKFDYQLSYTNQAHTVRFTVANIADEEPPRFDLLSWPYYEQRMYSPLGRTYSLEWRYAF